ncbi:V-set and immunoglobulin domain-containing protein 10 [Elgaria multicarinata webbii]|uniref:V-set and immunoglobulin domain-containing protein 10 n=1 Tax=Elgaria multicarinata webbii TaxID=159646 RepID=UPI002FCCC267
MASGLAVGLFAVLALAPGKGAAVTEELVVGEVDGETTLTCRNASREAFRVEWFHGEPGAIPILFSSDGNLPSDARFTLVGNSSLHISGLRLQDEGNYTCREVLNRTDHLHRIQLLMASGPNKVEVNIFPTTPLPNGTLYAKRHDILNFTCTSESRPEPTTKWDFSQSSSIPELFAEDNSSLGYFILHNMLPSYQGNYSCSATNLLSHRQKTVTRELLIYYPPPSLPQCWAQTTAEGSGGVQLFCSWPGGYPHPTLQWTKPENLSWAINTTSITDTAVATLNSSHLRNGKAFTCRGSHIVSQEGNRGCTVQLEAPSIASDPTRSCFVGRPAVITCQVTAGNPPAQITWLRNLSQPETEIQSGGRLLVSQEGNVSTLSIQNCSHATDAGYYVCKAENPLGLRGVYVYLTVTEPVNIAGIVGTIVMLLLVGILILSGILLYAGPRWCPKGNMLRSRDASDILVLMDSEEEDSLAETPREPVVCLAAALSNGCSTRPAGSSHAEAPSEIALEETKKEGQPTM